MNHNYVKKLFIFLFIILGFYFNSSSVISTSISDMYYAGCNVTGTDGVNVTVTATGKDITSGIDSWYCYNSNSNSWESCLNSSLCSAYKISGWNGYTKIKVKDKAGHESDEATLYKTKSANYSMTGLTSSSVSLTNKASNVIHVYNKTATQGAINSISYNTNGTINITGTADGDTTTDEKDKYTNVITSVLYSCDEGGTLVYKNGKWTCTADSYRLQNYTCLCVFDKDTNGKYKLAWDSAPGTCANMKTYCSDHYDPDSSDYNYQFQVVSAHAKTIDELSSEAAGNAKIYDSKGNIIAQGDWSSKYFTRPSNDVIYTYYSDFPAQIFDEGWYTKEREYYTTDGINFKSYAFDNVWFEDMYKSNVKYNNLNYYFYAGMSKNAAYLENAVYGQLKTESDISTFNSDVIDKLVDYASAGNPYTSANASYTYKTGDTEDKYYNDGDNSWFSSTYHPGLNIDNPDKTLSICVHLLAAKNNGNFKGPINTIEMYVPNEDKYYYVAPIVSSASCNWNEYVNENVPYSTCVKNEAKNEVYCCADSSITPTLVNGTYQCIATETVTITKFKYDYTINYYTK